MNNQRFRLNYDFKMQAEDTAEIMVYGGITSEKWSDEEVTAKDFDAALKDCKKNGVKNLNLRINSPGGSVFQAVAMRSMLVNSGMDINVSIEGLCASAATLLACVPGAKVAMAEGSEYMIHNPSSIVWGNAADMEKEAAHLRSIESDVAGIYAARTGKDAAEMQAMMDEETWMSAKEALELGFADSISGVSEAAACVTEEVRTMMGTLYAHTPDMRVITNDSNDAPQDAGVSAEYITSSIEEETEMDYSMITLDALREGNVEVFNSIVALGATQERERLSEIDDLTPAGYEEMAAEAKANGTTAYDFHKMIVKAQKQRGQEFLSSRQAETAPAAEIKAGACEDHDMANEEEEIKAFAKFAADNATAGNAFGGMY